jgi:Tol biopolymer transport system component
LKTDAYEQVLGWAPDGKSLFVESAAGGRASIVRLAMENGKRVGEPVTVRDGIDHLSPLGIDARGALYYVNRRADTNIKTMEFDSQRGTVSGTEKMLSNRHVNRQGFPSWSSDGRKIAWWTFLATPDTSTIMQPQLLVRNIDGGYDASVMPEKPFFPQQTPSWDAQNRSLLMLVNQGDVRTYRLSRLDPETGKLTPVSAPIEIPNVGASPIWTPDARYLFQRMGPNGNLVRRDIQTGEEQVIYDNANRNGALRQIALSPDGKRIAFSVSPRDRRATQSIAEKRILFVADLETGALKQVDTHNFAWGAGTLTWTPDGRWLVYPSDFNDKITPLWIVPSDLSAAPRALGGEPGEVRQIGFSPDGRTIHFSRTTRAEEYWVMDRFQ